MKIGVFDSGLGGLVITKAFIQTMPEFDYCYYGDTKNLPYGEKTSGQILSYTLAAVKHLIAQDCKLTIALRYIQQRFIPAYAPDIKVLGVVIPTVEEAVFNGAGTIGVIATPATVHSHIYQTELLKLNPNLKILELATPKLVPMIENNRFELADEICQEYAQPFGHVDSLILGCTHYPLVKNYFRRLLPNVKIISQDELMGAKLQDYLTRHPEIASQLTCNHNYQFEVSLINEQSAAVAQRLFPGIVIKEKASD